MRYEARDVAAWRRKLVEFYDQSGPAWYEMMIRYGKQPVRPAAPPADAALWLATREINALTDASLWYVDRETCDLVNAAYPSMPLFAPTPEDLPSRSGFALFGAPVVSRKTVDEKKIHDVIANLALIDTDAHEVEIVERVNRLAATSGEPVSVVIEAIAMSEGREDPALEEAIRGRLSRVCGVELDRIYRGLVGQNVSIVGVSWGPMSASMDDRAPAGGVWFSFYSYSDLDSLVCDDQARADYRKIIPELCVDNEAVVPWCPSPDRRDEFLIHGDPGSTYQWARMIFAVFRLVSQRGLCEQATERTQRAERRRGERLELPARDVTVVRLRRSAGRREGEDVVPGTRHSYRYAVRGHWRNQWYPSVQDHRPIYIDPHVRGPEGAEFRGGERVTIV